MSIAAERRRKPAASNDIIDSEEYAKATRKESAIQGEVMAWLAMQDFVFWRNNTGAAHNTYTRKNGSIGSSFIRYGVRGLPDILAIEPGTGRLIGIEVKRPGMYQTHEQEEWQTRFEDAGALYLVVRSADDLEAWWHARQVAP
jgi:hypothetical protein